MSWALVLRTHLALAPHLRHRDAAGVFECVARAHLRGPPGHTIREDGLSVLRQARWEMLKTGTPQQKARVLEAILACYADASSTHTHGRVRTERENHALGLEQLQCLLEAQLMGIPVRMAHYRFLLRSPQLSQLGPSAPLLLLREMEGAGEHITDGTRLDVGVGLAAAGRWEEALQLSPRAHFVALIERVAATQRHGWRHACILALRIGDEAVMQNEDVLVGVMAALALRPAAARDTVVWGRMTELLATHSRRHGNRPLPRRAVDYLLWSCPPEQWCVAMELVARHNGRADDRERIPVGRVMGMLNVALQWEKVLLLYHAAPSVLPPSERGHSAVHNHALVALARGGLWQQAARFYASHPVRNAHTHLAWLNMVLIERRIPFSATWASCVEAYARVRSYNQRFVEILAHDLTVMDKWIAALSITQAAGDRTPGALLITMGAAARASREEAVWWAAVELGSSHHGVSAKQLCTAAAIVACCTKGAPCGVSRALADALHRRAKTQQQLDDAVLHLGRCMAVLLHGAAGAGLAVDVPPAIDLLLGCKRLGQASASWIFALTVLQALSAKGWSLEAVAPCMLSSGLDAAVAIHFLPA